MKKFAYHFIWVLAILLAMLIGAWLFGGVFGFGGILIAACALAVIFTREKLFKLLDKIFTK